MPSPPSVRAAVRSPWKNRSKMCGRISADLPLDHGARLRGEAGGGADALEDLRRAGDGRQRVAQLVSQHREKILLEPDRLRDVFETVHDVAHLAVRAEHRRVHPTPRALFETGAARRGPP